MTEFLSELLGSATYSVFGFVVGWLTAHEVRSIEEIKEATVHPEGEGSNMTKRKRPAGVSPKIGYFLVVLAIFTVLQTAYFTYQQRVAQECFAEYQSDSNEVGNLRAKWADDDREALIDFFDSFDAGVSEEERAKAFNELRATYERNTTKREETPRPELVSCD